MRRRHRAAGRIFVSIETTRSMSSRSSVVSEVACEVATTSCRLTSSVSVSAHESVHDDVHAYAYVAALSLAKVTNGSYTDIPTELHAPIDQALVVCKGGAVEARKSPNAKEGSPARKFTAFVNSVEGRAIMKRYGFLLPSESLADVK